MQEQVELVRFRTFGELIEDSILFFKQNWKTLIKAYFTICGFFWLAGTSSAIINQLQTVQRLQDGESQFGLFYFLSVAFDVLSFSMLSLTVLSFISLYKEKGGEAPTLEEVWSYVKYYFFRVFGSTLALTAGLVVSFFFCVLPIFYFWAVFALIFPIMVIENSTLGYAFNRSFQLIKNNWWQTFGALVVAYIVIAAAMLAIAIPVMLIVFGVSFLTNVASIHTYTLVTVIITHLLQFVYMLPVITSALIYFSLNEQKDDGSLLARIQMIGQHKPDADVHPTEDY